MRLNDRKLNTKSQCAVKKCLRDVFRSFVRTCCQHIFDPVALENRNFQRFLNPNAMIQPAMKYGRVKLAMAAYTQLCKLLDGI